MHADTINVREQPSLHKISTLSPPLHVLVFYLHPHVFILKIFALFYWKSCLILLR